MRPDKLLAVAAFLLILIAPATATPMAGAGGTVAGPVIFPWGKVYMA